MSHPGLQPSYEDRCRQAAREQGLSAPAELLKSKGFRPQLLQTGGFTMALEAYRDPRIQVWVTQHDEDHYLVCAYRPYTEEAGEEVEVASRYGVELHKVPEVVTKFALEVFTP